VNGDGSEVVGITQRELLLEMRTDLKTLREEIAVVARDQAIASDRRATMQATANAIHARLDSHEKAIDDLQKWRDEAAGAIRLAKWALGASLLSSAGLLVQLALQFSRATP
jgi:hypothetical protein